jgi:hypothetical protein
MEEFVAREREMILEDLSRGDALEALEIGEYPCL